MTSLIILNSLFAIIAVGALAFVTRLAANVAGGRLGPPGLRYELEEPEVLRRAA